MTNNYLSLYSTITQWNSVEQVSAALNFTEIVAQDAATHLANQGVGDTYAFEVVESSTRVNYGQDLDKIHGLGGLVSMAANGAKQIKGGNFQIFENFVRESKASVHLNTRVTGLQSKSAGRWSLSSKQTNGEQPTVVDEYNAVILAAPFDTLGISLPSNLEPVIPTPYVHLHVTLLTTTSPTANPVYFNQDPGRAVPAFILTTAQGIRAGGPAPEFNSISYGHWIAEGGDERVVKIFSEKRIEDEWLSNVFGNVGWVHRKEVSRKS
jgi:prenylcysteine oxidase / farnesylcysteine lyase